MAENVNISTVLKRKLKGGKEFDILMPRVNCKTTPLGDGDTFFTVDRMKDWIEKYRHQTAKLALKLESCTIEETVNNIYNFLYNHVQYEADGTLQQLRSPACTWAQRNEGVDCKSYSVFASTILLNLGIKHAVRQVRQTYFYPEEFTHVYVVVYKDQSKESYLDTAPTFVLDATKHQNTEVNFIQKVDLYMHKLKHVGLNAPQDELTSKIIENFNILTNHFLENGISLSTVNAIRAEVSKFTAQGIDPKFEIADKGIVIQGKLFALNFTENKNYSDGLGFAVTGAVAMTAGKKLLDMLPGDFIGSTFGAVFANGFDVSCWNTSYNTSKATEDAAMNLPFLLKGYSGLAENTTTENYNKYLNAIYGYIGDAQNGQRSKFAKCTRKGYAEREKLTRASLEKVKAILEQSGITIVETGDRKGLLRTMDMPSYKGKIYEWGKIPFQAYTYPSARLEGGSSTPVMTPDVVKPGNNNYQPTQQTVGGGNNYQPTGNQNNGDGGNSKPNSSGSNTGLIIGGVALATLPFLIPMMKKSPVPAKKKTK